MGYFSISSHEVEPHVPIAAKENPSREAPYATFLASQ
jgi:hypothetical protein